MVDFNNETTVTQPHSKVNQFVALEHRQQVIASIERYRKAVIRSLDLYQARGDLWTLLGTLWEELEPHMSDKLPPETIESVLTIIEPKEHLPSFENLMKVWKLFNKFCYEIKLTDFGERQSYVGLSFEEANEIDGI